MDWSDWLVSMVGPLAKRVLAALGIGWITFESLGVMFGQAKDSAIAAWSGGGDVLVVAQLAGIGVALGVILGALSARLVFLGLAKLGKVLE